MTISGPVQSNIGVPSEPVKDSKGFRLPEPVKPASNLELTPSSRRLIQEVADKSGASIQVNQEELKAAIEELKQLSDSAGRNLGFSVDQVINRSVVVVSDKDSGKVVRQIPAEVVVKVAHSIEQMKGLLFDETF